MTLAMVVATIIFLVSLGLVISEKINRVITSIGGAAAMVVAGILLDFYGEEEAVSHIDFETIGLLFGTMMLVAILEPTGFFEYIAVRAGQLAGGKPWRMMALLGIGTAVISMFLNNVTAVNLVAPITVMLAELLGLNPAPFLMTEALLSSTAGMATSIGDPASVLVASASGYTFDQFLTHSLPVIALVIVISLGMLRFLFRNDLYAGDGGGAQAIQHINASEAIKDPVTMKRVLIVLGLTLATFTLQGSLHVSAALIALTGMAAALLWSQPDMRSLLDRVQWTVLIFFMGLFVMVGGLEATGALDLVAGGIVALGDHPVVIGIAIIWIVAGLSALVDNIPITIALIPVLHSLERSGLNVHALWWALVFGAGLGGNATLVGTTVNLVVVDISERTSNPITATLWSKRGLPVALVACSVVSVVFALLYGYLSR